ncbi:MAG: LEA type 2 family protein [Candidatus Sericytochromatia bacterium]
MKNFFKYFLPLFFVLFTTIASAFEKPSVSVENYTIDSLGFKKIDSTIFINVTNPNDLGIELKKVEYKVDINDVKEVANGSTKKVVKIDKKATSKVEVPVSFDNLKTLYAAKSIIQNPEKINYSVKGTVFFQTPFGDFPIPFTKASYVDNTDSINKLKKQIKALNPLNYF